MSTFGIWSYWDKTGIINLSIHFSYMNKKTWNQKWTKLILKSSYLIDMKLHLNVLVVVALAESSLGITFLQSLSRQLWIKCWSFFSRFVSGFHMVTDVATAPLWMLSVNILCKLHFIFSFKQINSVLNFSLNMHFYYFFSSLLLKRFIAKIKTILSNKINK